ncbi:hypothetical protein ACVMB3_006736 [Sinorhizobium meliloti]
MFTCQHVIIRPRPPSPMRIAHRKHLGLYRLNATHRAYMRAP